MALNILEFSRPRVKWFFSISIVSVVGALVGPLASKFGVISYQVGLLVVVISFCFCSIVLICDFFLFLRQVAKKRPKGNFHDLLPGSISLFVVVVMVIQLIPAMSSPPIHNISTNTQPPPSFDRLVEIRTKLESNPLDYRSNSLNEELQKKAYPYIHPFASSLSAEDLMERAAAILINMGIDIVNFDKSSLRIEATATSFWFGFKDDILVQIRRYQSGSIAEIRSVSRVGVSDLGKNAERIELILEELRER